MPSVQLSGSKMRIKFPVTLSVTVSCVHYVNCYRVYVRYANCVCVCVFVCACVCFQSSPVPTAGLSV